MMLAQSHPSHNTEFPLTAIRKLRSTSRAADDSDRALALERQVRLALLLNQINNQISSTLDLDEVLNLACQLLCETLNCSRASILVKESDDEETLVTRGEYNPEGYTSQLGLKVNLAGNPHLQQLATQPGVLAVRQFLEYPGLDDDTKDIARSLQIKSMLATSTRYQGQVNGIIGLHQCDREREGMEWEKQLLEGVAVRLGIAINHAQVYREARVAAEREALLRLLIDRIRRTLDLDEILETAVRGVRQLLDTDRVSIYQFHENWQGTVVVEDTIAPWQSILGHVGTDDCFSEAYAHSYQQGYAKAIDDIYHCDLDPCHIRFLKRLQVRANLIVPISIKGDNPGDSQLWGLIVAHECRAPRRWKTAEIQLLSQIADRMAIAIEQAELYERSQTRAQQLKAALEELQATQLHLIQSEKLSGLGKMAGGVAHEINNANNFIYANLHFVREYAEALIEAISSIDSPDFNQIREDLEFDYIQKDFPKLIDSMVEGSGRIRNIVQTLKNFSHLDEADWKAIDLNQSLDRTLAMFEHRLNSHVEVDKHYDNLPAIDCHPSQLNQVFFSLIDNALDAIAATGKPGRLSIRTQHTAPDRIAISIRDTGVGIDPEIQSKIFDPFFTTKAPGEGTGLGLSTCYQVIVKGHGGKINCISQPGRGTELIVELPVKK
ncbi:MAG: GAF domain-containing protein [Cyanobacteria bacterium J055]|nr:MAG: GAF domain-containing protein [Cyanobacteria bacterium J055]